MNGLTWCDAHATGTMGALAAHGCAASTSTVPPRQMAADGGYSGGYSRAFIEKGVRDIGGSGRRSGGLARFGRTQGPGGRQERGCCDASGWTGSPSRVSWTESQQRQLFLDVHGSYGALCTWKGLSHFNEGVALGLPTRTGYDVLRPDVSLHMLSASAPQPRTIGNLRLLLAWHALPDAGGKSSILLSCRENPPP